MFYRLDDPENRLPHSPLKAIVSPRPIGWISTVDKDGNANLAPYSFFNAVLDNPPMVMFSSAGRKPDRDFGKDTVSNIRETGEFVVNVVSHALKDQMSLTSGDYPADIDEFERAGLTKVACETVTPPRIAEAPAALECKLTQFIDLPGDGNVMVLGEVIAIHMIDEAIKDGMFDIMAYNPVARLGYKDYSTIRDVYPLSRPKV